MPPVVQNEFCIPIASEILALTVITSIRSYTSDPLRGVEVPERSSTMILDQVVRDAVVIKV